MPPNKIPASILLIFLFLLNPAWADVMSPHAKSKEVSDLIDTATLKQLKPALKLFKKAISIEPDCPDIYYWRAITLESNGYYTLALRDINKAVRIAPEDIANYAVRSRILFHLSRYEDALKDTEVVYKSPLNYKEKDNTHKRVEGMCLYHLGRYEEATWSLYGGQGDGDGGACTEALYYLGLCYLKLSQPQKALKYFNLAINYLPENARHEYYLGRAEAFEKLGKMKLAAQDRKTAVKIPKRMWGTF